MKTPEKSKEEQKSPTRSSKQDSEHKIVISGGNVAVVCRFRPLNEKEKTKERGKICPKFIDSK